MTDDLNTGRESLQISISLRLSSQSDFYVIYILESENHLKVFILQGWLIEVTQDSFTILSAPG